MNKSKCYRLDPEKIKTLKDVRRIFNTISVSIDIESDRDMAKYVEGGLFYQACGLCGKEYDKDVSAKLNISNLIFLVFATTTTLLFIITVVTYFWKISVHGAGIGGAIGFIIALSIVYPIPHFALALACLAIITGLIAYARLSLNAHTPLQVYVGVLLGIVLCYSSLYFFL